MRAKKSHANFCKDIFREKDSFDALNLAGTKLTKLLLHWKKEIYILANSKHFEFPRSMHTVGVTVESWKTRRDGKWPSIHPKIGVSKPFELPQICRVWSFNIFAMRCDVILVMRWQIEQCVTRVLKWFRKRLKPLRKPKHRMRMVLQ